MRRLPAASLAALALALALALGGCGDAEQGSPASSPTSSDTSGPLVVSAAASLQEAFERYGQRFDPGHVRFSFGGSDELAGQIRQGVRPDVFASANTELPRDLHASGLVEQPRTFARNRLVLAVPARSETVTSLGDIERPGTKVAVGSESVPIGSYTRKVLARLPPRSRRRIEGNVRSREPDVKGIVGKLRQGAIDAGFVYLTDVTATRGALRPIELPPALQPSVAYGVAVVRGAKQRDRARRFVDGLIDGQGQRALRAAGFEPPPK